MFKKRPLPRSKKEAIDLMMEQPNLIRRPILVRGSKVIFGFKKDEYWRMSALHGTGADIRVGTSGWSYPSGKGTWNGIFYPDQPARRPARYAKFDELAFYAEHFDTVEVNSSFYRRSARRRSRSGPSARPPASSSR